MFAGRERRDQRHGELRELDQTATAEASRFGRLGSDQVNAHEPDGTGDDLLAPASAQPGEGAFSGGDVTNCEAANTSGANSQGAATGKLSCRRSSRETPQRGHSMKLSATVEEAVADVQVEISQDEGAEAGHGPP